MAGKKLLIIVDTSHALLTTTVRISHYIAPLRDMGWTVRCIDIRGDVWKSPEGHLLSKEPNRYNSYSSETNDGQQKSGYYSYIKGHSEIEFMLKAHIIEASVDYDLVYFIKINDYQLINSISEKSNAILIYDLCDAVWKAYFTTIKAWNQIGRILSCIDIIFAENPFICSYASKFGKPVFDLKSYCVFDISDNRRNLMLSKKEPGIVVIGWMGTPSTSKAIYNIAGILNSIAARHNNVRLRIVGYDSPSLLPILNVIKYTCRGAYDEDGMIDEILGFDIGIFPISIDIDDYKLRGAHKGIKYMGVKVPAVFHNAGDCVNFIQDGVNGMLCADDTEWEEKIERLVVDADLRNAMGQKGYETIVDDYSYQNAFNSLCSALAASSNIYIPRLNWME